MKSKEFLITPENLPAYLVRKKLAQEGEPIVVRELGGGVSNIVLLVEWPNHPERRWVVKQSLGKLRVKDDWRSDRKRIIREAESIRMLRPVLGQSIPEVIHLDRRHFVFVMTAAPVGSTVWKESLLVCRRSVTAVAHEVGVLLARLICATEDDQDFKRAFEDRTNFEQLRIDPYYRTTANRHSGNRSVSRAIRDLIKESSEYNFSLVHGDYSPKNILVHGRDIFLIDFEVVHWGDPSFDAGFLLNHLFLKSFHRPGFGRVYMEAARSFWEALRVGANFKSSRNFENMTIRHLGALMLARIDGKSPVEYIQDEATQAAVRESAIKFIRNPPLSLDGLFQAILESY